MKTATIPPVRIEPSFRNEIEQSLEGGHSIVSEFETEEQKANYNQWFKAKVEEALHSEKPRLPHDAAMANVQALLKERRKARANRSLV